MATVAHSVLKDPARSRLVDRIVGPDVSDNKGETDSVKEMTMSLEGLLNPTKWDLPGWNTTQ